MVTGWMEADTNRSGLCGTLTGVHLASEYLSLRDSRVKVGIAHWGVSPRVVLSAIHDLQ